MKRTVFILFATFGLAHAGDQPQQKLDLHVVPTPIKSYRLLSMSMDDDAFIWAGAKPCTRLTRDDHCHQHQRKTAEAKA